MLRFEIEETQNPRDEHWWWIADGISTFTAEKWEARTLKTERRIDKSINQIGFPLQLFIPSEWRMSLWCLSLRANISFLAYAPFLLFFVLKQTEQFRWSRDKLLIEVEGNSLGIPKLALFKHFAREWVAFILPGLLSRHVLSLPSTFPFFRSAFDHFSTFLADCKGEKNELQCLETSSRHDEAFVG